MGRRCGPWMTFSGLAQRFAHTTVNEERLSKLSRTETPMSLTLFNQLLHLLADGKFHSGSELGERLYVSRAAIWKQLQGAESLGLVLHRVRGKGYRIPGGLDLLDVEAILRHQPKLKQVFQLQLEMSADSTNRILMAQLAQQSIHGQVVLAEVQTAGRGRLGRQWHSPFAQQLAMSIGWQFHTIQALQGLSLLVGLAVVKTLTEMGITGLSLKWPNDILLNGHKLAGILIELQAEAAGLCQVVIGIGMNVHMTTHKDIDQAWTSLLANGYDVSRNHLVAAILQSLHSHLLVFSQHGFAHFKQQWQDYHSFQNQQVVYSHAGTWQHGLCQGVNDHGALLVAINNTVSVIHAGDVSIRLAAD